MATATTPAPPASTPAAAVPPAENVPQTAPPQGDVKPPLAAVSAPIPPNKPDEPAFQLKIEPDARFEFKSDKLTKEPCQIEVKLTNPTKDRQTFKVSLAIESNFFEN